MKFAEEQHLSALDTASRDITARPSKVRYVVLSMLLIATILNYVDRSALGIVAPSLRKTSH